MRLAGSGADAPTACSGAVVIGVELQLRAPLGGEGRYQSDGLRKHPAMPLDIFSPVAPLTDLKVVLERGEDGGSRRLGSLEVRLDVIDVHEHTVDNVSRLRPDTGDLADLSVVAGALVGGTWVAQHDYAAVELHIQVGDASVLVDPTTGFAKAEGVGYPVGRAGDILEREHRDNAGQAMKLVVRATPSGPAASLGLTFPRFVDAVNQQRLSRFYRPDVGPVHLQIHESDGDCSQTARRITLCAKTVRLAQDME